MTEPGTQPSGVHLHCESHVDARFEEAMILCRKAIEGTPVLHHLAHFTKGVFNFDYDWLDTLPGPHAGRDVYARTGTQVSNAVVDLDRQLYAAETGALIRTVAHGQHGLLVCNSVVPKEHVVAFCHNPAALPVSEVPLTDLEGARQVDSAIGLLVTELRRLISQQSQNPGSWITPKPDDAEDIARGHRIAGPPPHIDGDDTTAVARLLAESIDPADLQFVTYCRDFQILFAADHLGHPAIGSYFQRISVAERRAFYYQFCEVIPAEVRKLGRMVSTIIGGRLERVVLDVEQGAVYYYRIRPGEYLVGVTVDQGRVAVTDSKIARLARACQRQTPSGIRALSGT